jgi:tetratricopeptide (TPR) repeat protein
MTHARSLIFGLLSILAALPVRASEPQVERARVLFDEGRQEFQAERYQSAYDKFHEAYALSPAPALLYNMAAALEALGRPGEAAEKLRAYLRVAANEPNRAQLDARARSLDEAQRQIDVERLKTDKPRLLEMNAIEQRGRRRGLAIGLGIAGGVVVGLGLALGLYFGLPPRYPDSTLGTQRGTP